MQLSTFAPMCFDKWERDPGSSLYGGEKIALKMKKSPPMLGGGESYAVHYYSLPALEGGAGGGSAIGFIP